MEDVSKTFHGLSHEEIDAIRSVAQAHGGVYNSFTQPSTMTTSQLPVGIQFFDFDTVGKKMFNKISILRNRIPRVKASGTAFAWREILDINVGKVVPGVSEGNRNAVIARSTKDRIATFAGLGMENVSTFEAKYAAQGVANVEELARIDALEALQMAEERVILGGNKSNLLGTPAAPAGVASAGGSMTARTVTCRVVALTMEGKYLASVATGVSTVISRTNADGSVDSIGGGSSMISAASAGVAVGAGQKVTWSVTDIPQAMYWAWYTGTAGNERLAGITSTNQFIQTTDESGSTQLATAITADNSRNLLEFDGMIPQILRAYADGAEGYFKSMNNVALSADAAGNVTQLVNLFWSFYDKYQSGPTTLVMDGLTAYEITKMLLSGPAAAIYQNLITKNDSIVGGFYVQKVLNPFTQQTVNIEVHPYMPTGTIMILTDSLPFAVEGLGNMWEMMVRQEYYSIDWPLRTRKRECGVYVDEGLKLLAPFVMGIIKNIYTTPLV